MLNRTKKCLLAAIVACLLLPQYACVNDKLPEPMPAECDPIPVYDLEVKPIVESNCSTPSCHDGSGNAPRNYTTYQGMLSTLENGSISDRVLVTLDMPPSYASFQMSAEDLEVLRCWLENGFPKN